MKLAVFISGTGTNMVAIHNATRTARSMRQSSSSSLLTIMPRASITRVTRVLTCWFSRPLIMTIPKLSMRGSSEALEEHDIEYVAMAGYMRKVTPVLLDAFPNRVVNLHPALLPKHRGAHAIQDAFEAGDEVTGITIHFANEEYDKGPIIFQHEVPVLPDDTIDDLETRIHAAEHEYYPQVLQQIARGEVQV